MIHVRAGQRLAGFEEILLQVERTGTVVTDLVCEAMFRELREQRAGSG